MLKKEIIMVIICNNKLKIQVIYCNILRYYYLSKEVESLFKKRSKAFFTSIILATIYLIYIISYFYGILGQGDTAEQIGSGLATALVTPHIVVLAISVMFGWLAFGLNSSGFALTASILYTVAGVMFIPYIFFVIPSIILGFVGYANQKNINNKAKAKRRVKVHKKSNVNNKTNLKA